MAMAVGTTRLSPGLKSSVACFDFTGAFNAEPYARLSSGVTHGTMKQMQCSAAWGRWKLALVSYWEWFKLIGTALLISSGITGAVATVAFWVIG
jgi:hypothetical protein